MHFLEWKRQNSDSNFTEICYQESNWQQASIGSGNSLAPNRRQAITWTNADPVYWCIYAAYMRGDELWPRQNGRHLQDDIFKCIFLKENTWISINISLKFVPKGPFNNIPALVRIIAWGNPVTKPLFEPMVVSLLTHICVTRPQWVNWW